MFEFTKNFYEAGGNEGGSEPSFTPGQVIIPEQTVFTVSKAGETAFHNLNADIAYAPDKLFIEFDGFGYTVERNDYSPDVAYYGETVTNKPSFNTYPFFVEYNSNREWYLYTPSEGSYTISAKIPEEKSSKVLSFPKGRTIVSELSRLNKAFGTVSKKKTIIGQLSDIADAAEAGKIGGGSGGAFMVHSNNEGVYQVLDKTWQEIYDALKTTSVYIITENEEDMSVSTEHRIVTAQYSDEAYQVYTDDSSEFVIDSSDGYPKRPIPYSPIE